MTRHLMILLILLNTLAFCPLTAISAPETDSSLSRKLGIDFHSFTSTRSLVVLGITAAGSAWIWEESDENFPALQNSLDDGLLDGPADWGNTYGEGLVLGGTAATLITAGYLGHRPKIRDGGVDMARSFVFSSIVTGGLKHAVSRTRPSGGPLSFPSGHTTVAFSTVPVAWHHGGWKLGVPCTLLASMTAIGRMEENKHYLSDVIAGAAIGTVVGWAVISQRRKQESGPELVVSPRTLGLAWRF